MSRSSFAANCPTTFHSRDGNLSLTDTTKSFGLLENSSKLARSIFFACIASHSSTTNHIRLVHVFSLYSSRLGLSTAPGDTASGFDATIFAPQSGEA